jgi:hypothetical protein
VAAGVLSKSSRSALSPATKRALQAVAVAAGQLSSPWRMTPGFLICGAQRSGTTSMYRALAQHPAVLKPVLHKGVHYFDTGFGHSASWYRGHFPTTFSAARVRRSTGTTALTFESSPYYLCHPLAPGRIARELPGVKIVVLLRDPVERAYSAHAHELARGYESEDFATALALEESRLAGEQERLRADPAYYSHAHQHHAYRARGEYVRYLREWERLVGRERIHVVDSGVFFARPAEAFAEVAEFLGLPPDGTIRFEQHNARPRRPLAGEVETHLRAHFRPWDEELAHWWGRRPSWIR